jgi:hypothetical protein
VYVHRKNSWSAFSKPFHLLSCKCFKLIHVKRKRAACLATSGVRARLRGWKGIKHEGKGCYRKNMKVYSPVESPTIVSCWYNVYTVSLSACMIIQRSLNVYKCMQDERAEGLYLMHTVCDSTCCGSLEISSRKILIANKPTAKFGLQNIGADCRPAEIKRRSKRIKSTGAVGKSEKWQVRGGSLETVGRGGWDEEIVL